MSGKHHPDLLSDSMTGEISDRCSPEIMDKPSFDFSCLASLCPRAPEVADFSAAAIEDPGDNSLLPLLEILSS